MKRTIALCLCLFASTAAMAGDPRDRVLVIRNTSPNNDIRSNTIQHLQVTPTQDTWSSPDMFGNYVTLPPGGIVAITVPGGGSTCRLNFVVHWGNGEKRTNNNVNVCNGSPYWDLWR